MPSGSDPASVVNCAAYVGGHRVPECGGYAEALAAIRGRGDGFVWIGLYEPDETQIQDVATTFGLHELAVEDVVQAHQRPKLERYGDTLFMVLKTVRYVEHESPTTTNEIVETGEIMAFLGKDFIVTVRHGQHSELKDLRADLEAEPERLAAGPSAVLYAIADHVVDLYVEVTQAFQTDIDVLESLVFAPRSQIGAEQMYLAKREIIELRHAVTPLAGPLRKLAEGYTPVVPEQVRSYFRDVEDHLAAVTEQVGDFDELLTTLVNATLAKVSLQQNNDMRKITAWAAIIAIPTMVVGVYGMNFDFVPELHWHYGYPIVIAVVLVAGLSLYRTFKRNKWL